MLKRIIIIFFLLSTQNAYCQVNDDIRQNDQNTSNEEVETGRDSTTIVSNAFFDIFYGKPGRAAFYGLIAPGGGQIYNKKWWKLPLVYAVEGGTIYWIVTSTYQYSEFQKSYLLRLENPSDLNFVGFRGVTDVGVLKSNRDKWRKQREYSWIIFLGGHLITIFEAFIDRHLMEFDVSDDLTFEPIPSVIGAHPGFTYTIGLNKKKGDVVVKEW